MTGNPAFNFTKSSLLSLPLPPPGKRRSYKDMQERGLIIDVRSTGWKSFYLYKKINGRPERLFLGAFPDISVDNARKAASVFKGQIALGRNPQQEKRSVRDEMLFSELFDRYLERHSKPHKATWKQDEKEIPHYAGELFRKKLSQISNDDVRRMHVRVGKKHGLAMANKTLARVKSMFNRAAEWGWKGSNPALYIKKFPQTSRDRFLQPEELPVFFSALEQETNQTLKDYVWLLLLTGSRKSKVGSMRWEDIRWHHQQWAIPMTKNGDPLVIPLPEKAMQILQARFEVAQKIGEHLGKNPVWVFPSGQSVTGHISCPFESWKAFLKRAKITGLRMHDLRRTLASYQAITGASLQIIGKSLGHRSPEATQIYARLHVDPVRDSVGKAINAMFALSVADETKQAA